MHVIAFEPEHDAGLQSEFKYGSDGCCHLVVIVVLAAFQDAFVLICRGGEISAHIRLAFDQPHARLLRSFCCRWLAVNLLTHAFNNIRGNNCLTDVGFFYISVSVFLTPSARDGGSHSAAATSHSEPRP